MILDVMKELVVEAGLGTPNKDLFYTAIPAPVDQGIALKTPLAGVPIDSEQPGFFRHSVQVIVRSRKHEDGRLLADKLRRVLTISTERRFVVDDGVVQVTHMLPVSLPIEYPRSEGSQFEFSLNFRTVYCHAI